MLQTRSSSRTPADFGLVTLAERLLFLPSVQPAASSSSRRGRGTLLDSNGCRLRRASERRSSREETFLSMSAGRQHLWASASFGPAYKQVLGNPSAVDVVRGHARAANDPMHSEAGI